MTTGMSDEGSAGGELAEPSIGEDVSSAADACAIPLPGSALLLPTSIAPRSSDVDGADSRYPSWRPQPAIGSDYQPRALQGPDRILHWRVARLQQYTAGVDSACA